MPTTELPALADDVPPDPGSADAASPRLQSIVESLLFAADKPLSLKQLGELLEETEIIRVRSAVAAVELAFQSSGIQLHGVAGGYQFRTNPQNAVWVQKLLAQKPVRLTRAQLETLAICAYRQPITRPEIDEIRGVDSGGTLKTLMDRSLVRILGKKEEPGRPMLYGTTREFLEFFNLKDLKDLPTLREFHELSEEHQAQVAALEGAAPAGTIETEEEAARAQPAGPSPPSVEEAPPLSRLEISSRGEDERELEEIDRMIATAGASVATDSDLPPSQGAEFDAEPTQTYGNPIVAPHVDVSEEFDRSETTNRRHDNPLDALGPSGPKDGPEGGPQGGPQGGDAGRGPSA
jgi:segregation and condensation protein B